MFKLLTPLIILSLTIASLMILEERQTFDVSTLVQIDPIPHTKELIKEQKYVEAKSYLSYFMAYDYVTKNPESSQLMQVIDEKRASLSYKTQKVLEGIFKGKSDEFIGQTSALASDFLVVGDIRDLSIEGVHYLNDEKVDKLMVALSSLGLIATASTLKSKGKSVPVKESIFLLKYAKRTQKIPLWLESKLIKQIAIAKKTKSLKAIRNLLIPIQKLYQQVGLNQALILLHKSRNLKALLSFNKFATRFGKKSQVLLKVTNYKALSSLKKMPNISNKNFLYASTYGANGLKGLEKLGTNKFMKRVGFGANLSKTTYKGNLNALLNSLLKNIPNNWLYLISIGGLFYFLRKFFLLSQYIFPKFNYRFS